MMARMLKSLAYWLLLLLGCFMIINLSGCKGEIVGMLNPKGFVAYQERRLFFDTLALMLIVVLPVIVMSFTFVYHYQISHRIKDYKPNWSHDYFLETLWWFIPCLIIVILAILTWRKTHELDPFHPIPIAKPFPPLLVQAIALPWKWLFIYPEQGVATINYLMMPLDRQVVFSMTNDNVPMSGFFIPQIGSQILTMAGMHSRLHLLATSTGEFKGLNTQFNGSGFSDMHFVVHVVKPDELQQWFAQIKQTPNHLDNTMYDELLKPSMANDPQFFSGVEPDLFNHVLAIYRNSLGPIHPRQNIGFGTHQTE